MENLTGPSKRLRKTRGGMLTLDDLNDIMNCFSDEGVYIFNQVHLFAIFHTN